MKGQKIEHEIGSGKTFLVNEDGTRERIVNYDIKVQLPFSEFRTYFWPSKKADRKLAREHFAKTGEILDLNKK